MYISKIQLRNWKTYEHVEFEFPAPTAGKNIVLIGAPNGYGKTSLYQAIILCMFGQEGMVLLDNPMFSESNMEFYDTDRKSMNSYSRFLNKALHRGAIAKGHRSCSVKIEFADSSGPIEISRNWHFSNSGDYLPLDEEIQIFEGENRAPCGPSSDVPHDGRNGWYRDYIARTFLPRNLATFFVFDGEQVRNLARRDMKLQVKLGIEGLLGVPDLKSLSNNLNDYRRQRLQNVPSNMDESAKRADDELKKLEDQLNKNIEDYGEIYSKLSDAKEERTQIMDELVNSGVGAQAQSQQQYKELIQCQATVTEDKDKLNKLLTENIALALSGIDLRRKLKIRLESENIRAIWESGMQHGDSRIENFLDSLDKQMDNIVPPINDAQQSEVLKIARKAWSKLWFPPPSNCAKEYVHQYFDVRERGTVIDKLKEQDGFGATAVVKLLHSISENESRCKLIRGNVARFESVAPEVDKNRARVEALMSQIEKLDRDANKLKNEQQALKGQINAKQAELGRMNQKIGATKPARRRAERARVAAAMVDKIIEKSVPKQMCKIGDQMTDAHKSMAHKKNLIQRIDITDGDVKLLNMEGEDVRANDLSAGEEQVFTQSLFSAVSAVSERAFPMVVDTPLARLDSEHREGVLKHFAQRGEQVILLSTDTEVVGKYLKAIAANIQEKYLIEYYLDNDIGCSTVKRGYFSDLEAKT